MKLFLFAATLFFSLGTVAKELTLSDFESSKAKTFTISSGDKLSIELGGVKHSYLIEPSQSYDSSVFQLKSREDGLAKGLLLFRNGELVGEIQDPKGTAYNLSFINGKYSLVEKNDKVIDLGPADEGPSNFDEDPGTLPTFRLSKAASSDLISDKEFSDTVSVLFMHDPSLVAIAESSGASITQKVRDAIALTNEILVNSGLQSGVRLTGIIEHSLENIGSNPSGISLSEALNLMQDDRAIARIKRDYEADVVFYITANDPSFLGIAKVSAVVSNSEPINLVKSFDISRSIGSVRFRSFSFRTVAHELGHILGLQHDRNTLANHPRGGGNQYDNHTPYGYSSDEGGFYTTMAYSSACRAGCTAEYRFSDPNVTVNGFAAGKDETNIDAADAVSILKQTIPLASNINSLLNLDPLHMTYSDDGIIFEWGSVDGASGYHLLPSRCDDNSRLIISDIEESSSTITNQVTVDVPDLWQAQGYCVVAKRVDEAGTPSYMMLASGEIGKDTLFLGGIANQHGIFMQHSNLTLNDVGDTALTSLTILDESIENDDFILTNAFTVDDIENRNWWDTSRSEYTDDKALLDSFFSVVISGEGRNRTVEVTLLRDWSELETLIDENDIRSYVPWLLRVGYVVADDNGYPVPFGTSIGLKTTKTALNSTIFTSPEGVTGELEAGAASFTLTNPLETDIVDIQQTSGPELGATWVTSFSSNDNVTSIEGSATFTSPAVSEDELVTFAVFLNNQQIGTVNHTILRRDIAPTVQLTSPNTATAGSNVNLSVSVQDDGSSLVYSWVQTSGPSIELENQDQSTLTLLLPPQGSYQFEVTVTDDDNLSATLPVSLTINAEPSPREESSGGGGSLGLYLSLGGLLMLRRKSLLRLPPYL